MSSYHRKNSVYCKEKRDKVTKNENIIHSNLKWWTDGQKTYLKSVMCETAGEQRGWEEPTKVTHYLYTYLLLIVQVCKCKALLSSNQLNLKACWGCRRFYFFFLFLDDFFLMKGQKSKGKRTDGEKWKSSQDNIRGRQNRERVRTKGDESASLKIHSDSWIVKTNLKLHWLMTVNHQLTGRYS